MRYSVQMVGVGGQGVLLASMVIGNAALAKGLEVVMSEVHGMAQRGGSVTSTIRMGEGVVSPLIPKGGADLLVSFEPVEAYRNIEYANRDTFILTNTRPIVPITVSMGADPYPPVEQVIEALRRGSPRVIAIDATQIALGSGGDIATNSVLIGAVAAVRGFPLTREDLLASLLERVPERAAEMNKTAFERGFDAASKAMVGLG